MNKSCDNNNGCRFEFAIPILAIFALCLASCSAPATKAPLKIPRGYTLTWFADGSYRIWPSPMARRSRAEITGSLSHEP